MFSPDYLVENIPDMFSFSNLAPTRKTTKQKSILFSLFQENVRSDAARGGWGGEGMGGEKRKTKTSSVLVEITKKSFTIITDVFLKNVSK